MKSTTLTSRILFVVSLVFLLAVLIFTPSVAHAQLPPSYVETVQDAGLEWWADLLELSEVKATVQSWFNGNRMYDFSEMDDNPIVVAVIDSGVDVEHEIFTGDYGEGCDVFYRNSRGALICKNTVAGNSNVNDVSEGGHGTHVAGILAEMIHWLDLEKYIKIMPIMAGKPSDRGASFAAADVKEGIEFALENGADVINLSLESTGSDFKFVSEEWASKAIFVAAAGNGRTVGSQRLGYDSKQQKCYPAADEQVIGVMNISNVADKEGNLALSASSNYGDVYDLCAPGSAIYSAKYGGDGDDGYIDKSGTSMATPIVSFASALALLKFRAIQAATGVEKTMDEVREIVKFSSISYIVKGDYQLSVLNLRKLAAADSSLLARIDIEAGLEKQQLGALRPIPMYLHVLPEELEGQGSVEWFVNDERVGEGFEMNYTPKAEIGSYVISAYWTVDDSELGVTTVRARNLVTVSYATFTADSVKELVIGVESDGGEISQSVAYEEGKEYVITFAGVDDHDPDKVENYKWFVNGKLAGVGRQLYFTPDGEGSYEVFMRTTLRESNVCAINFFKTKNPSELDPWTAATIAVVVSIAAVVAAVSIAIAVRKKRHAQK